MWSGSVLPEMWYTYMYINFIGLLFSPPCSHHGGTPEHYDSYIVLLWIICHKCNHPTYLGAKSRTAYVIIINCTFPYQVFHNKIPGTLLKCVKTVKNGKVPSGFSHLVEGLTHVLTKQGLLTTFPHNDLGSHFPGKHSPYLICYQRSSMHAYSKLMHCCTLCHFSKYHRSCCVVVLKGYFPSSPRLP